MLGSLRKKILRTMYRLLVVDSKLVCGEVKERYATVDTFCKISQYSDKGAFVFEFKLDQRESIRDRLDIGTTSYVVNLEYPKGLKVKYPELDDCVVVVRLLSGHTLDYGVLTELLRDIYIGELLRIRKKDK